MEKHKWKKNKKKFLVRILQEYQSILESPTLSFFLPLSTTFSQRQLRTPVPYKWGRCGASSPFARRPRTTGGAGASRAQRTWPPRRREGPPRKRPTPEKEDAVNEPTRSRKTAMQRPPMCKQMQKSKMNPTKTESQRMHNLQKFHLKSQSNSCFIANSVWIANRIPLRR